MAKFGGKQVGAGRPKGSKDASTLSKEQAREATRKLIMRKLAPLVDAQIANAMGIKYLVIRDKKTGKFIRVTETMAVAKLASGEEIVEIWEKDPSVPAFTDLMNRALDKAKEQPQEIELTSGDVITQRLETGRKRAADR